MKSLSDYLKETTKEYKYFFYTLSPVNDVFLANMVAALKDFDIKSLSNPVATFTRTNTLAFKNETVGAVTLIEFTLGVRATNYELLDVLVCALNIPDTLVEIRNEWDVDVINAGLNNPETDEIPDCYGMEYNMEVLKHFNSLRIKEDPKPANYEYKDSPYDFKKDEIYPHPLEGHLTPHGAFRRKKFPNTDKSSFFWKNSTGE